MENIQVMLLLARLFGFNSYRFRETEHGYVATLSKWGMVVVFINIFLFVYFAVENVRNPNGYSPTGSAVVDVGGKIILELGYFDVLLMLVQRFCQSRWTIEMLDRLRSIDRQLLALGVKLHEVHSEDEYIRHMAMVGSVTICALLYTICASLMLQSWVHSWPMLIGHMYVSIAGLVITCIFYGDVFTLRMKVRAINLLLRKLLCDDDVDLPRPLYGRQIASQAKTQDAVGRKELVSRVGLLYDDIHSISLQISDRYKLEFAGFCMLNALYGVMALYTFYRAIFKSDYIELHAMGICLVWSMVYKLNLLQMVKNCHFLLCEGSKTTGLIIYATSKENDVLCNKKMHSLLCQMQHNPIKVTTYFFDINFTILFAIIGAMSTYLFIMIQFIG